METSFRQGDHTNKGRIKNITLCGHYNIDGEVIGNWREDIYILSNKEIIEKLVSEQYNNKNLN